MVERVRMGPRCSGVKLRGRPHKFQHIAEQNVIGSARIARLCLIYGVTRFYFPNATYILYYNLFPLFIANRS